MILGQICSLIGNYTLKFALSMHVLEITGSASVFAGILSLAIVPAILLAPFGGILADRANRRNIMVVLDAFSGIAVLLAAFAMKAAPDIPVIAVLLIILSVLGSFESPTVQACIPQMLSGENLLKGNAIINQAASITSLAAPFLGSLFYTAFGIRHVFYTTTICFFITAIFECFIQLKFCRDEQKMKIRTIIREDFTVSMTFLRRKEPGIMKLLLLAGLVSLFLSGTAVIGFPFLVRTVLGLSAAHYGAAESAMGAASVMGSMLVVILAGKLRYTYLATVISALGLCLIPCGVIFLFPLPSLILYGLLMFFFCICQLGCSFFSTYAISIIQQRTPEYLMGKVMSYVFTLSMCAQPMGQILYGALFDRFSDSVYWVLIPSGLLIFIIGLASSGFFGNFKKQS